MDAIAKDVGAVAAARRLDAVAEKAEKFFEGFAREIAIGPGACEEREEVVLLPGLCSTGGDDLLHEDVERLRRDFEPIERAALLWRG